MERFRLTGYIYYKLFNIIKPVEVFTNVNFGGYGFKVKSDSIPLVPSMMLGDYEKYELQILRNILKPGMIFVDIGANIGIYSIIASHIVGEKGKVYAFEPEPNNFELLNENILQNNCSNVIAQRLGMSEDNSQKELFVNSINSGAHSLVHTTAKSIRIETRKLDDITKNIRVDFIKMDIEGGELEALKGMKNTLTANPHIILMMEFNPYDYLEKKSKSEEFTKFINTYFKNIYQVNDNNGSLENLNTKRLLKLSKTVNIILTNQTI